MTWCQRSFSWTLWWEHSWRRVQTELLIFCSLLKFLFSFYRTLGNWMSPTSASISTTPQATWTLIGPFPSVWLRTSLSSWPLSVSPGHSPPPWSPWLDASHNPTSRWDLDTNPVQKSCQPIKSWLEGDLKSLTRNMQLLKATYGPGLWWSLFIHRFLPQSQTRVRKTEADFKFSSNQTHKNKIHSDSLS